MTQLPVRITHSLQFLTNFKRTVEDLYSDVEDVAKDIEDVSSNDEDYGNTLRKITKKVREREDDALEVISDDVKLFYEDMKEIISKKNDEDVIYSLHNFKRFVKPYEDLKKDLGELIEDIEHEKDISLADDDFIRVLAYNRIVLPAYKFYTIIKSVVNGLHTLTGKKE